MLFPSVRRLHVAALLTVFSVLTAHAKCDPTTDPDESDIANARAAVAANCDCTGAQSHGAYVSCAAHQANATLVNKSCGGAVKKCAARSTCGKPNSVTCCRTGADGVAKCKVKKDAAHCTAPRGGTACVGAFTSCCDACAASGCATTTTTTTTTSTTLGTCTCYFLAATPGVECPPHTCVGSCSARSVDFDCASLCATGSADCLPQSALCGPPCP